jgi:hypothetical protein
MDLFVFLVSALIAFIHIFICITSGYTNQVWVSLAGLVALTLVDVSYSSFGYC